MLLFDRFSTVECFKHKKVEVQRTMEKNKEVHLSKYNKF